MDATRLTQALSNLISNACKFSPQGETVQVAVTEEASGVRVSVMDQGPGIAEEFQPRIFEKFSQADASDSRKMGGSGLGLSISKSMIEAMGGRISFETKAGAGTKFWIEFPPLRS